MKKFSRIFAIGQILFCCSLCLVSCVNNKQEAYNVVLSKDFNIVLIVIDTLRSDHLPFYGYSRDTAPFLSKVAAESAVFEKVYSTSSWTAPATASLFTSLYPFQHGVVMGLRATRTLQKKDIKIKLNRIPDELHTIPELLKEKGYKTYAVTDNINICKEEGFAQGFDRFINYKYKTAKVVNDELKRLEKEIKSSKKYFLYIHYMDPHIPYNIRKPWFDEYDKLGTGVKPKLDSAIISKDVKPNLDRAIAAYDSEINYVDEKIRELFELFGWQEDTLLIITSDHGEEFYEHKKRGHAVSLYNEAIHIPLIMYFPQGGIKNKRISSNVGIIDILPTLREIVGLPTDNENMGMSLMPLLRNNDKVSNPRYIYSHLLRRIGEQGFNVLKKSIIHNNWKYIENVPGSRELYNLEKDPRETWNRIDEEVKTCGNKSFCFALLKRWISSIKNSVVRKNLESHLVDIEEHSKRYVKESVDILLDKNKQEQLRTLGYIQ